MSRTDDWADGWNEGHAQGIRDCITAVAALPFICPEDFKATIDALCDLIDNPPTASSTNGRTESR